MQRKSKVRTMSESTSLTAFYKTEPDNDNKSRTKLNAIIEEKGSFRRINGFETQDYDDNNKLVKTTLIFFYH